MDRNETPNPPTPPSMSNQHKKLERQCLKLLEQRSKQRHQQHLMRMGAVLIVSLALISLGWYLLSNTALDWQGATAIVLGIIGLIKSIFTAYHS
ncbi:hypothetical protein AKN93_05435 [Thiopseudomonas alkaliphila]|uniref:hypothetical protein n=1 Tax=Thiopseudomonas alkaliphila TaxID=1697053 RepID=UPI00069FBE9C|nr:hypothetical protein [Thiopseudomonas alkaliphila]AKX48909.1 hypothetical protein AKN93_05435 [Thiopseudomonas alkaliphila]